MKIFDGKQFLASKTCQINLSNGRTYVVKDLSDDVLQAITEITEQTPIADIRKVIAKAIGAKSEDITDVGMIELQGVLAFLSESLLGTESPNEITQG